MEEIVGRAAAAAAEEVGEVLRLRLHLGADVDDRSASPPSRCCGRYAAFNGPLIGALFIGGTAMVCADGRRREIETRRDHHADGQ